MRTNQKILFKLISLVFIATLLQTSFANTYTAVITLGPVDRPITPTAANAICNGIYQNLTAEALHQLDISQNTPFQCEITTDKNNKKSVVITTDIEIA